MEMPSPFYVSSYPIASLIQVPLSDLQRALLVRGHALPLIDTRVLAQIVGLPVRGCLVSS